MSGGRAAAFGLRERMEGIAAETNAPQPIELERQGAGVEVDMLDLDLPDGQSLRPTFRWRPAAEKRC